MYPTVFTIPWLNLPIRAYGLMLMIGFLGGTWFAARRAARVKCDPDLLINIGFVALIASVVGARAFYVLHYWDSHFAGRGLWAAINITAGGMEFYGGFIGAFATVLGYLLIKRVPIRLYLDILAPSLMFGLGMTRIGCFLNGCCWGAVCDPNLGWSVRFPYASPASYRQWEDRIITYPAELLVFYPDQGAGPLSRDDIDALSHDPGPLQAYSQVLQALEHARDNHADASTLADLRLQRDAARKAWQTSSPSAGRLAWQEMTAGIAPMDLLKLAKSSEGHTHAVQPAQLYSSIDGLLAALLLSVIFYRRKRHGVVAAMFFLLYPIMRFCEEIIRSDNPHDVIGLTISQFISVAIFAGGLLYLIAIYRMPANSMPAPSPAARQGQPRPRAKQAR